MMFASFVGHTKWHHNFPDVIGLRASLLPLVCYSYSVYLSSLTYRFNEKQQLSLDHRLQVYALKLRPMSFLYKLSEQLIERNFDGYRLEFSAYKSPDYAVTCYTVDITQKPAGVMRLFVAYD